MRPDDPQMQQSSLLVPQRPHAPVSPARSTTSAQQQAVADMARDQLEAIYANDPNATMDDTSGGDNQVDAVAESESNQPSTPQPAEPEHQVVTDRKAALSQAPADQQQQPDSPYERTHSEANLKATQPDWSQYHSAWQKYYQEYYHRYYNSRIEKNTAAQMEQSERIKQLEAKAAQVSPEEAMDDIRSKLRATVRERSKKVRKSRHFVPLMAAVGVMLVFGFLQYNRVILGYANAYVSPGSIDPANVIVDPNLSVEVGPEPRLIIPKINVDVPAIYEGTMGSNQDETYDRQMAAMNDGVAWFGIPGADSKPGQLGNTVLSGHSSNDWFDLGDLKFVFASLDKLTEGDVIYANYKGTRYTYSVIGSKIVLPQDLNALQLGSDKPMLTLITCTPLGTSEKRLLIFAEQVSPDPASSKPAPDTAPAGDSNQIPGVKSRVLGIF